MQTRMSVGKKLYVSFGAGLALTYLVGICSLMNIGGLGQTLQTAVSKTATKQKLEGDIGEALSAEIAAERGMLVYASRRDMDTAKSLDRDFANAARNANAAMEEMKPLLVRPESKQTAAEIAAAADQMTKFHGQIYQIALKGDFEAALRMDAEAFTPLATKTQKANQKLIQGQNALLGTSLADAQASIRTGQLTTCACLLLAFLVGLGVLMTVRGINRLLRRSVEDLGQAIGEVSSASEQLAVSSQALAQGTSDQAATLEDTSASSSEINSMAQRNTDNSRSTMQMMSSSQGRFEQANQSLDQMVQAMEDIADSSVKISKIIKVIDEIAFQTNILALNAAVEAARAGDAGMGFAVVADEVRSLAQRSAQAARDTAELIEDSIAKSAGGKLKVNQVAEVIHIATGESLKMKVLIDEISLGSVEQARGIDQISKAIVQLEQSTQNSAANAEEGASVAEELSAQTGTMKEVLAVLALLVEGGSAEGAGPGSGTRMVSNAEAELRAYTS